MHLLGRKLPQQEEEAQLASMEEQKDAADSEDDEKVVLQSHSVYSHPAAVTGLTPWIASGAIIPGRIMSG